MNKYETIYILKAELEDQARADLIEKFGTLIANNGGEVLKLDEWGKRRLAYPIQDLQDGYYVLTHFNAPAELPKELERNFRIADEVLRYLVIRLDD